MNDQYNDLIKQYATAHGLPWRLVYRQIEQESNGDYSLVQSGSGALGLMQLMPSSFPSYSKLSLLDPETNIKIGTSFLRTCIDYWQNEAVADERYKFGLASYNAGQGNILSAQTLTNKNFYPTDKWSTVGVSLVSITGLNNALQTNWYVWIIWSNYQQDVANGIS
jgi:membrane-bound lytic murein transglycosylase F